MTQRNIDIRNNAKQANVRFWEIAEKLEMSESTFTRFLRKELDINTKNRIFSIIQEIEHSNIQQSAYSKQYIAG